MILRSHRDLLKSTARYFTLAVLLFGVVSCDRKKTPDWGKEAAESQREIVSVSDADDETEGSQPSKKRQEIRFIAYNVKNWLTMDRYTDRRTLVSTSKPEEEKSAVISILSSQKPEVVGLCEIGTVEDLADLQERLKKEGVDLPHSHFTGGADPVRHLGFLSKFPIIATGKPSETDYQIQNKLYLWNRGVLDVTIDVHGRRFHFLGAHLKSKREVEEGDEELMRRGESQLLRRHIDAILAKNPEERLIVYGDFNDTRSSVSGKIITDSYNDPGYLTAIPAEDSSGTRWTHHWELHDIYSRIDFIAVSKSLKPHTDFKKARVLDAPEWSKASDHRAVLAVFR